MRVREEGRPDLKKPYPENLRGIKMYGLAD
jgi:hypothetical protein